MSLHIVFPLVLSLVYLIPMTAFGLWLGLGPTFAIGLALEGLGAALAVLMAIGGLVQIFTARNGAGGKAEGRNA